MRLLAPHLLHLAWLALIPLALYLFRKKARRVPVSTLLFFRSLSRAHQESAWLRRIKKWLSLLLTLLVLLLSILALARPGRQGPADAPGAVVLVLDRSASMAAVNPQGTTRLREAQRLLRERLQSLPDQIVLSLIAFDSRPHVLLSRSRNRRECIRLLEQEEPVPIEGRAALALDSARRLSELDAPSQIWFASDSPAPPGLEGLHVTLISAALDRPVNAGITAFQIRPAPLSRDRFEGFVQVSAASANAGRVTSTLEVTLAGRLAQLREIDLDPGQRVSIIVPLEGVRGQRVELRLRTPGDCLPLDDGLAAPLPQARPLVVAWVADKPDPFTELALTSMIEAGRIEMMSGDPTAWPLPDKPDVFVFEHWLPDAWPRDRPVIALDPAQSGGPVRLRRLAQLGIPHESIRSVAPDHPVLFRVSSSRLALTQTSLLELTGSLEPLWMAGAEPVLVAGEVGGQRLVVSAFSPSRSENLALQPAFPLLLGNALYWCAEGGQALAALRTQRTGQILEQAGLIQWTEWTGTGFSEISEEAVGGLLPLKRIGAWRTDSGAAGASLLASTNETDIPARGTGAAAPGAAKPPPFTSARISDWPKFLVWLVLGLLLLESFLFHRQAVY